MAATTIRISGGVRVFDFEQKYQNRRPVFLFSLVLSGFFNRPHSKLSYEKVQNRIMKKSIWSPYID